MGSRSRSSNAATYNTETKNFNLQEVEGITVAGNEGAVNVSLLDAGAVGQSLELADTALKETGGVVRDVYGRSLDLVESVYSAGLESQGRAVDSAFQAFAQAKQPDAEFSREVVYIGAGLAALLLIGLYLSSSGRHAS